MDDLWYSEYHTPNVRFSIKINSQLHRETSNYQTISVFDSVEFGRFLTLDGIIMLTERDEFIYHALPGAFRDPDIRTVADTGS